MQSLFYIYLFINKEEINVFSNKKNEYVATFFFVFDNIKVDIYYNKYLL